MTSTKIMTTTELVLENLRRDAEGGGVNPDAEWLHVYLDNARPAQMSVNTFRACLATLSKAGLYKVVDGWAWGSVKMK